MKKKAVRILTVMWDMQEEEFDVTDTIAVVYERFGQSTSTAIGMSSLVRQIVCEIKDYNQFKDQRLLDLGYTEGSQVFVVKAEPGGSKHIPCKKFAAGNCTFGDKCHFGHASNAFESGGKPTNCRFFPMGKCTAGEGCKFSHDAKSKPTVKRTLKEKLNDFCKQAPKKSFFVGNKPKYIGPAFRVCPKCQAGCMHREHCCHMTCQQCQEFFCFLCLKGRSECPDSYLCRTLEDGGSQAPIQQI